MTHIYNKNYLIVLFIQFNIVSKAIGEIVSSIVPYSEIAPVFDVWNKMV